MEQGAQDRVVFMRLAPGKLEWSDVLHVQSGKKMVLQPHCSSWMVQGPHLSSMRRAWAISHDLVLSIGERRDNPAICVFSGIPTFVPRLFAAVRQMIRSSARCAHGHKEQIAMV